VTGSTDSAAHLSVVQLHKSFGSHQVLDGLDLVVPPGSFMAVLGPSGCGKTTLLRVLAGFERPDSGVVSTRDVVLDDATHHVAPSGRRLGYVSQDGSLFPHLDVRHNVGFGLPRARRRGPVVLELLERVGLAGLEKRFPHELSGGQQQRVAIARALAVEPRIVLLDEPFAALDDTLRASVRADVRSLLAESGATSVLVTHDLDEALSIADVVAVMRSGRIAQLGSPEELYAQPVDAELAGMIGGVNLIPGTARGSVVTTFLGTMSSRPSSAAPRQGAVIVLVRPEQVRVLDDVDAPGTLGVVVSSEYHGHDVVLRVETASAGDPTSVLARVLGEQRFDPGTSVRLTVTGTAEVFETAPPPPTEERADG
jgi:iron(III) transport system ATP-binding protein